MYAIMHTAHSADRSAANNSDPQFSSGLPCVLFPRVPLWPLWFPPFLACRDLSPNKTGLNSPSSRSKYSKKIDKIRKGQQRWAVEYPFPSPSRRQARTAHTRGPSMPDLTATQVNIDSTLDEQRTFEPPAEFSQKAQIKSLAEYEALYKES